MIIRSGVIKTAVIRGNTERPLETGKGKGKARDVPEA